MFILLGGSTCLYLCESNQVIHEREAVCLSKCVRKQCLRARGSGGSVSQVINASERQLWSGLTHLEISFKEERQNRRAVGKREEETLLYPLKDKQK